VPRSTHQSETILVLEEGLDEGGTLPVAAFALHGGARFQTGIVGTRPGPIPASAWPGSCGARVVHPASPPSPVATEGDSRR
jgi:hypothetical protein